MKPDFRLANLRLVAAMLGLGLIVMRHGREERSMEFIVRPYEAGGSDLGKMVALIQDAWAPGGPQTNLDAPTLPEGYSIQHLRGPQEIEARVRGHQGVADDQADGGSVHPLPVTNTDNLRFRHPCAY